MPGSKPPESHFRKLQLATDLALKVTKKTTQGIGCSVGSLVALQHYLWLMLIDMSDSEKALLLDMPISPHGLFGNAVGYFSEKFLKVQKQSKVLSHVLPKWGAGPAKCPRSSSVLRPFRCQDRLPAAFSSGSRKDPEPAVWPKLSHFNTPRTRVTPLQSRADIPSLLAKEAIEVVQPEHRESGLYCHYVLVPKTDSGLQNRTSKALIQNYHCEADPCAYPSWGLVCVCGFKRRLFI